jgi:hypothetical protein
MSKTVTVVPHTHWDREWYSSFEAYRSRLIPMMDRLLDLLESRPDFVHFHLDGQVALVDDYLGIRPEQAGRIVSLVESGRLAIGPWYVLMDEFAVSGETIIRNLQLGLARANQLGGATRLGYLPDMFGHIDQMPQILDGAGIGQAVVWRGVPAAVAAAAFWWLAPDGSRVRAEYLPVGYANGAFLPSDPESFLRRIRAHDEETVAVRGAGAPILLLNGGDHHEAQAGLPDLLVAANAAQDEYVFSQSLLLDYLRDASTQGLPTWSGELRSGARANLLMGVLSNRTDIKRSAAESERRIEKLAEPLAALWLPKEMWPQALLDQAWLCLIRNSAHDSICACSSDEVARAVGQRYDSAQAIAETIIAESVGIAGVATDFAGPVVVNPSARPRRGVIELVRPGPWDAAALGQQLLSATASGTAVRTGNGADLARILGELAAEGWLGKSGRGTAARIGEGAGDGDLMVILTQDDAASADPAMASTMAEIWARAGAGRDRPLTVRVERDASHRVAVVSPEVPGFGWAAWEPSRPADPPVTVEGERVGNGLLDLQFAADGTFSINGVAGFGALVESGDDGDTYNYSPPEHDLVVDRPASVSISMIERGPLRARVEIRGQYIWPTRIVDGSRVGRQDIDVLTEVELRAGEGMVRLAVSFDNRCLDHRVRAVVPLPAPVSHTVAETAFGAVTRGLVAEGGPHELALPTFPSRRFVCAGDWVVTHDGLLEYELVDGGRSLALTLLRATGTLSKAAPRFRPNAAGPALPAGHAQMVGPHRFCYAVAPGGDPWVVADDAWVPLITTPGTGTGHLPRTGRRLSVSGAEVSALYRRSGRLEVRVFNPGQQASRVEIPGHSGCLVDLSGNPVAMSEWVGGFELEGRRIATARLDALSLD